MESSDGAGATPADAARRIKDSASNLIDRGKEAAASTVEKGAERARSSAQSTAGALRRAADDVETDNRWIGSALRKSADGLERAATSLEGGDISRAVDDLNGFARRNPALFLGASLAVGFALARVGKTAVERASDGATDSDDYYSSLPEM